MKKIFLVTVLLVLLFPAEAKTPDSLFHIKQIENILLQQSTAKKKPEFLQYGFRLGVNLPLSKEFTSFLTAKRSFSAEFGFFARAGKLVFGELGFGYTFQKNTFEFVKDTTEYGTFDEIVEIRSLQIPIKVVGVIEFNEFFSFLPHAGIIYQPVIQVTKNLLGQDRNNLTKHQLLLTTGFGVKVFFFTLDIEYRLALFPYFKTLPSNRGSYLNISLGFQL